MGFNSWAQDEEVILRVARISYLQGTVSMERTSDQDWIEAILNTPLMEGDKLYSGPGSRVEIQLEDDVAIRLDGESYIHFERLDQAWTQIRIGQGTVAIHARPVSYQRPWIEVNTLYSTTRIPDYANVCYRVEEEGLTEAQVRRGTIEYNIEPEKILRVERNEMLIVKAPKTYLTLKAKELSEFEHWCDLRDAINSTSRSSEYITNRVSGYNDLDRYGEWYTVADYGPVWRPRVTLVDWAPYRYGRWRYRNSCGWVWISDEPWGWAPYHYGRWVYTNRHGWCWVPGNMRIAGRPRWSPALVGFVYSDHGTSIHISIGSRPWVGWFPLGPRDPYWGWYGHDHHHYREPHHDDHRYQNIHVANAVSVIPREDFGMNHYERLQRSTLKQSESRDIVTGSKAIEDLNSTLFKKQDLRQNRLKTTPAPRLASQIKEGDLSKGSIIQKPQRDLSSNQRLESPDSRRSSSSSPKAPDTGRNIRIEDPIQSNRPSSPVQKGPDLKVPDRSRSVRIEDPIPSSRPSSPSKPSQPSVRSESSSSADSRVTYIGIEPVSRSNKSPKSESRTSRQVEESKPSVYRPPKTESRSYSRSSSSKSSYHQYTPEPRSYIQSEARNQTYTQPKQESPSYIQPEVRSQTYTAPKPEPRSYSAPSTRTQSYSSPKTESSSYREAEPRSYNPPSVSSQPSSSNRSPSSSSSSSMRSSPKTSSRGRR